MRQKRIKWPLPYQPIVITGVRGAGKNVVYDALTGRINSSYFPGGQSLKADDWRVKTGTGAGRRRLSGITIIPGQIDWSDQEQLFNQAFRTGHGATGVIHVVSWGYDWIWKMSRRRSKAGELLREQRRLNLGTLRRENLRQELDYFNSICQMLKETWAPPRPPGAWLIIAVTKCDLYWPRLEAARRYYLPTHDGDETTPFRAVLSDLVGTLHYGGLRRLAVLPVSSIAAPYDFSDATDGLKFPVPIRVNSSLGEIQRQALVNRLQRIVGEFNARR